MRNCDNLDDSVSRLGYLLARCRVAEGHLYGHVPALQWFILESRCRVTVLTLSLEIQDQCISEASSFTWISVYSDVPFAQGAFEQLEMHISEKKILNILVFKFCGM